MSSSQSSLCKQILSRVVFCMFSLSLGEHKLLRNNANFAFRLTCCTHHCVMDANGNEQFIRQFANLCSGGKLLEEDIKLGNANQNSIFPPIKPGEDIYPFEEYRCGSSLNAARGDWPPAPSSGLWRTFRFTQSKIAALKREASALCSPDSDIKYISSNDPYILPGLDCPAFVAH